MLIKMREARQEIKTFLTSHLERSKEDCRSVSTWSDDLFQRLDLFMERGKMLRGGMVLAGHDLLEGRNREAALMTAAAIELIHSGFLIHDDIMDRDQLRRGEKTVYYQYELFGEEHNFTHPHDFGQSMGICAGDEAFFLAYDLLLLMTVKLELQTSILRRVTLEMKRVGLAQMSDVVFGHVRQDPSIEEILNVYRYKTAYYTFSLPLYLAASLAGITSPDIDLLEEIGESLGIIFQLKDDDLGVFGNTDTIGKPSGSDIQEDKKTLFRHYLKSALSPKERESVENIFGKAELRNEELDFIRELSEKYGARKQIDTMIADYAEEIRIKVDDLTDCSSLKPLIIELLDYSLVRTF